ncbi:monocarboxylate transporter 12-like isoform X2 [Apostichopus japonicus]
MKVFSSRTIVVVGGFLVGAGFICEAFLVSNLWTLYISIIISGVGFGLNNIPLYIAISDSFGDSFGTVMSVTGFFANIGIAVVPPLLEYWREKYGLAGALTLFGAFMWNQILSGVLIQSKANTEHSNDDKYNPIRDEEGDDILPSQPEESATAAKNSGGIYQAIVSHPTMLCLYAAQFFHMFVFTSWSIFLLPYGVEKGYEQGDAVLLSTFGGSGILLGRAVIMFVFYLKWQSSVVVIVLPNVLLMATFVLTIFTQKFFSLCFESCVMGICLGYTTSWMFCYGKDIACLPHFNSTAAWSMLCLGFGVTFSAGISGFIHDIRGAYVDVFLFMTILVAVKIVFIIASISFTRRNPSCYYGDTRKKGVNP